MRRAATMIGLMMILAFAGACREEQATTTTATQPLAATEAAAPNLTPEELGELGAQIKKEPARADELLAQKKLTRQSFEKAIREVTESPEASKRYAAAYRKAAA